jgi:integrase
MAKSTTKRDAGKPTKPHPDFPLYAHNTGRWAKKVHQKTYFFGTWDDPDGALAEWLRVKDDLLADRTPRPAAGGFTLRELLDRFMVSKRDLLDNGEITARTFTEAYATCKRLGDAFGLRRPVVDLMAGDFERLRRSVAKRWGPIRLANEIQRVRSVFKFGYESGLIDKPVRFGPGFKKPSRKVLRLNRASKPPRMFEAAELRKILAKAGATMRAMILLAVNCGYGNGDVASLPITALDLQRGWIDFPRPKTGIARRCPLWTETITALQTVLKQRPTPKASADEGLVFITKYGHSWVRMEVADYDSGKIKPKQDDSVAKEFTKLLKALELRRPGVGFYALRHTFETIGGDSRDQVAVNAIMGHVDDSMACTYRERIDDARLRAVVDHVHGWLFCAEQSAE